LNKVKSCPVCLVADFLLYKFQVCSLDEEPIKKIKSCYLVEGLLPGRRPVTWMKSLTRMKSSYLDEKLLSGCGAVTRIKNCYLDEELLLI
jgi:hypothetical protein